MTKNGKRALLAGAAAVILLPVLGMSWMAWEIAHPQVEHLSLPSSLIAAGSGAGLPSTPEASADFAVLGAALQSQQTRTGCGPASAATVLSALRGSRVSQDDVFSPAAAAQRSRLKTFFAGMPLDALGAMLRADGAEASVTHAGDSSVEAFRDVVRRNESTPADFLIVNFLRTGLGQDGGGHFSPLGAYDGATDRVLILDVATLRYPPVWARVADLFAAMDTVDPESGATRGWVEVQ